jgi:hypothetical protein
MEETMTTQRKFEQRNPTSKAAISPDGAASAKRHHAAELDDDVLDRVTGGFPPSPCAPRRGRQLSTQPVLKLQPAFAGWRESPNGPLIVALGAIALMRRFERR